MRSTMVWLLGGALVLIAAAGCGSKKTYTTPEGQVTVEQKDGDTKVTVETEEGRFEMEGDEGGGTVTTEEGKGEFSLGPEASEEDVGIPLYPRAQAAHSARWTDEEEQEQSFSQVHLTTADSFEKVKTFYREKRPDAEVGALVETPEIKMFQMTWEEDEYRKMVVISRDSADKETAITLSRMPKSD